MRKHLLLTCEQPRNFYSAVKNSPTNFNPALTNTFSQFSFTP